MNRRSFAACLITGALVFGELVVTASASGASSGPELRGRYVLRHTDDFAHGDATFRPMVELDDGTLLKLELGAGERPSASPGDWVRVDGTRHERSIAVDRLRTISVPQAASAVTGTRRVAVVLFTFSDTKTQPYTPAFARGVAFTNANSVAAYYAEASGGQLTLTGDVFGWYTIPNSSASCAPDPWAGSASAAAAAAGVDLNAYDHVVFAFPQSSCGWAGLGVLPGRTTWLNGAGAMSLRVMAHELGHNLGTHHASTLSCTVGGTRVTLSSSPAACTANEYGDPFTIMGSSGRHHHTNFSEGNFGWLGPGSATTVTSTGEYTLAPIEPVSSGAPQLLLIPRTASTFLSLEFRQPYGSQFETFASSDPVVNGVTVRVTPGLDSRSQSHLVDATPGTTSFSDAPLAVGKTLVDPLSEVSMTVLSVASSGATVRVAFGPDITAPTAPAPAVATALDGSRMSLSWPASSDDVAVAGYRVYRNSALVATVSSTGFTDGGLAPTTTYAYQIVAFDAAGNVSSPANATATTLEGDSLAPTAPTNLRAVRNRRKVSLTWTASTDNVAVAGYQIYRNGSPLVTTTHTSFTDSLGNRAKSVTYYVVAFDAAGNVSARSTSVTVSL